MTGFDYTRMAATSVRLLQRFGAAHTLTRREPGLRDVESGTTPMTATDYTVTGLKVNYQLRDIDGTLVRAGDAKFLMAPDAAVIARTGDRITIAGMTWEVVGNDPLTPTTVNLLQTLQIRQ